MVCSVENKMKRTLLIAAASLLVASCGTKADPEGTPAEQFEARVQAGDPVAVEQRNAQVLADRIAYTDPVTGCDYIQPHPSPSYGTMPRMDRDGFHVYCAEQKERDRQEALERGCSRPRMSDGTLGAEVCINTNSNDGGGAE